LDQSSKHEELPELLRDLTTPEEWMSFGQKMQEVRQKRQSKNVKITTELTREELPPSEARSASTHNFNEFTLTM